MVRALFILHTELYAFMKGADSHVLPLVTDGENNSFCIEQLAAMSKEGLRTLAIASKRISLADYEKWKVTYEAAALSLNDRFVFISWDMHGPAQDILNKKAVRQNPLRSRDVQEFEPVPLQFISPSGNGGQGYLAHSLPFLRCQGPCTIPPRLVWSPPCRT